MLLLSLYFQLSARPKVLASTASRTCKYSVYLDLKLWLQILRKVSREPHDWQPHPAELKPERIKVKSNCLQRENQSGQRVFAWQLFDDWLQTPSSNCNGTIPFIASPYWVPYPDEHALAAIGSKATLT
jgi:hypothetical protein